MRRAFVLAILATCWAGRAWAQVTSAEGYTPPDDTPSIRVGVENVSGASLRATYLVDVVSAASADIVSTASPRWQEVRQAGTLSAQYKPSDFGVAVGGSMSSEPDYLSYGGYAMVIKDFDSKNWTVTLGYGFSHDTAGRCGAADAGCTPFSVFSPLFFTLPSIEIPLSVRRASTFRIWRSGGLGDLRFLFCEYNNDASISKAATTRFIRK